jgi:hypothetical protein
MAEMRLADAGVIYVATGESYRADALTSAASLKRMHPELPVCLFSDKELPSPVFDLFKRIENPHRRSKIDCMRQSPFRRTLFLDTDTRIVGNVTEPLELLERFDIAMCLGKVRLAGRMKRKNYDTEQVPASFYPYNSGVMYFRRSEALDKLFADWSAAFLDSGAKLDQIPLRELLWRRPEISVYNLPPEFNSRELSQIMTLNENLQQTRVLHLPLYNSKWSAATRTAKTLSKFQLPFAGLLRLIKVFRS